MKDDAWLIIYFPSNRLDKLLIDTCKHFEYVDRFIVEFQTTMTKGAFGDKKTLELCIFKKGSPKIHKRFYTDILPGLEDPALLIMHPKSPMWKPTLATAIVLRKIVGTDKILLDPFAGYGSIIFVAEKLKMRWLAFEINEASARVAKEIFVNNADPYDVLKSIKSKKTAKLYDLETLFGGEG